MPYIDYDTPICAMPERSTCYECPFGTACSVRGSKDLIKAHWQKKERGYHCTGCNYMLPKGEPFKERCPACRKHMSQHVVEE